VAAARAVVAQVQEAQVAQANPVSWQLREHLATYFFYF